VYERFIARQPIFDRRCNVFGYELLFRGSAENEFTGADHPTAHVIVDSTMLLRIESLVGPGKAFFNMTPEELRSGSAFLLSSHRTVIEITQAPAPGASSVETILACQNLQQAGYHLVLDGFQDEPHWQPLLPFASFLKVDFRATSFEQQKEIAKKFSGNGVKIIGKKIETREEFDHANRAGYSFFQGFFFLQPELFAARDLPASKLNALRLLRECAAPELRYANVEEILKQEPSLLYKLLRYLNSAALGLAREVASVPHAIALLGEREFRRWVSVVATVAASLDEPVEVLRSALVRGYFCERLAQLLELPRAGTDFFLMGLLSVMDVLFGRPLSEILAELPLASNIRTALLGGSNVFRDVYEAALAYEAADWQRFQDAANRARLKESFVAEEYEAAVRQASSIGDRTA
jgi:c-di-GMP-related signal transduction protein